MACFLVPTAEAIVVTIVKKHVCKKEAHLAAEQKTTVEEMEAKTGKISFGRKLGWLTNLLWGGAFLLALEHIWHGEVVPWPPFLTAMSNSADTTAMLHEMSTVGVTMAILVTAIWCVTLLVANYAENKAKSKVSTKSEA